MVGDWTYTLDENERDTIVRTAHSRHTVNRKRGTKDDKVDIKRDPLQVDREGMAGEIIFGALANLFVDLRTGGKIPIHDFLARDGTTIDVKTTRYPDGQLLLKPSKLAKLCDWYALVLCRWEKPDECPTGRFVGGVHREYLTDLKHMTNLGHGATFALKQDQLLPPAEFIRLVTRSHS